MPLITIVKMSSYPLGRIGCWWSEKKSRKFNVQEFSDVCRTYGFELVKIDLNRPLEDQGPFIAIVHKLTDIILKAEMGDLQSKAICQAFQEYIDDHPNMIVIDPLPSIKILADRCVQYKRVAHDLNRNVEVFIPSFVELTTTNIAENLAKMKAAGVDFPIVCKPTLAHGSTAHQMCIIFNEDGLKDIAPPCVVQKFINHNAVLYKLFTIGNKYFMIERPSLKNFSAGDQKTIFFNSHEISKPHSASVLNELDDNDEQLTPCLLPEKEKMDYIVEALFKCLGLNLLGIDVIIDNKTGHYGVVDINVFPGYDEVDSFFQLLCELIVKKMSVKVAGQDAAECKPTLLDCVVTPRRHQKFNFDSFCKVDGLSKAVIPNVPQCICCPISSICLNKMQTEQKNSNTPHAAAASKDSLHFHSEYFTQDDSGIETSDSCDEKKDSCHRTMKRLHSRLVNTATVRLDGSS